MLRTLAVGCLLAVSLVAARAVPPTEMEAAAQAFLAALDDEQRARATARFADSQRLDWHFIPRERSGISLGELPEATQELAYALLATALSEHGQEKVRGILVLEAVLRELESRPGRPALIRDPGAYHVAVFGAPDGGDPWGWSFEGHHVSLNFTSVAGALAFTPLFLGASPSEVRQGEHQGLEVLGAADVAAETLLAALDDDQRRMAARPDEPPEDVYYGPGVEIPTFRPGGLPAARMNASQRALLRTLLVEFVGTLSPERAAAELKRMDGAFDAIHFLWIGEEGAERSYYRLHGLHFLIEVSVVEPGHVHTLWRDMERDFGGDLLN